MTVLALGGTLLVGACGGTSYSCRPNKCHVTIAETRRPFDVSGAMVEVLKMSRQEVTLTVNDSDPKVIGVGQSAKFGRYKIKVTSVDENRVKFDINGVILRHIM